MTTIKFVNRTYTESQLLDGLKYAAQCYEGWKIEEIEESQFLECMDLSEGKQQGDSDRFKESLRQIGERFKWDMKGIVDEFRGAYAEARGDEAEAALAAAPVSQTRIKHFVQLSGGPTYPVYEAAPVSTPQPLAKRIVGRVIRELVLMRPVVLGSDAVARLDAAVAEELGAVSPSSTPDPQPNDYAPTEAHLDHQRDMERDIPIFVKAQKWHKEHGTTSDFWTHHDVARFAEYFAQEARAGISTSATPPRQMYLDCLKCGHYYQHPEGNPVLPTHCPNDGLKLVPRAAAPLSSSPKEPK